MFALSAAPNNWSSADEERSLAILGRLFLDEIASAGTPAQFHGMLRAIGRRAADLLPLAGAADLGSVAERINGLWNSLNWGNAGFELDDDGIDIVHRSIPSRQADQLQDWDEVLPPVLEGAYERWFEQLGSDTRTLHTRVVRRGPGRIELRHGL